MNNQVIIIGAGITGLTTAKYLKKANIDFVIIESDNKIGGRVQSKVQDGYILDKGFQVLLTAYPEVQRNLNLKALQLGNYDPGAMLLLSSGLKRILGDPLRDLNSLIPTLVTTAATVSDKWKIYRLSQQLKSKSIERIFDDKELTTLDYLKNKGFSNKVISNFFNPFFSGIFLERELNTSSRMFEFVFKMFSEGFASLPKNGIQAIPNQLAETFNENILLNEKVISISNNNVITDKQELSAEKIVVAVNENANISHKSDTKSFQSTTHVHFLNDTGPYQTSLIALNTNKERIFNNLSVVNQVQSGYGKGKALISASIVGKDFEFSEKDVKKELGLWFPDAEKWELIDKQIINYALPTQSHVNGNNSFIRENNVFYGGDYLMNGSLNSAMKSGRLIAEEIISEMQ